MIKKVIFVGGTSFSGSTFFHLTLANHPSGFGIGEVDHLFWPTKERHKRSIWVCGCGDPACDLWERVKKNGAKHLYASIFDIHPEVEYIVDSSKNVVWIDSQSNWLAQQGIEARCVVIWKTLLEYAHSLRKRNRLEVKDRPGLANWPRYHLTFYSFINDFGTVKYSQYTQDHQTVLQAACEYLDIPYFEGKERFWEREHHVLGGNLSARLHLYPERSNGYEDVRSRAQGGNYNLSSVEANYRQVYYENPDEEPRLQSYVAALRRENPYIDQIEAMLTSRDVCNPKGWTTRWPDLQLGPLDVYSRQARTLIKVLINRHRFTT